MIRHEKLALVALVALVAALPLLLSACWITTAPLHVPDSRPPGEHTAAEVHTAILRALTDRGWDGRSEEHGVVLADVESGGHSAVVRISYDATGWRIEHVSSSEGLRYDAAHPTIHRRYNHWVERLDAAIRADLATGE